MTKLVEIPEIFFSSKTNSPFTNCLICNKKLLKPDFQYFVLKSYRYYKEYNKKDVTYELALCSKCEEMMYDSYSDESKDFLDKYWEDNFDHKSRAKRLKVENYNINDWVSNCACKGKHWTETNSFNIYGVFNSTKLRIDYLSPYMLSDEVMDDFVNLLSNHTIDSLTKLFEIYIDFPPDFKRNFIKNYTK